MSFQSHTDQIFCKSGKLSSGICMKKKEKKRKATAITILIFVTKERASLSSCSSGKLKPKKDIHS